MCKFVADNIYTVIASKKLCPTKEDFVAKIEELYDVRVTDTSEIKTAYFTYDENATSPHGLGAWVSPENKSDGVECWEYDLENGKYEGKRRA